MSRATRSAASFLVERPDGVQVMHPDSARAFIGLLGVAQDLERELDAGLQREHGISLRVFSILLHLAAFSDGGRLRICQLAERAALVQAPLSQSRLSRLVADLERDEFVARTPAAEDSRGVEVSITERGLDKLREAQTTHNRMLDELFFSRLAPEEIEQVAAITATLGSNIDC